MDVDGDNNENIFESSEVAKQSEVFIIDNIEDDGEFSPEQNYGQI